jgi:hypothetical protein
MDYKDLEGRLAILDCIKSYTEVLPPETINEYVKNLVPPRNALHRT